MAFGDNFIRNSALSFFNAWTKGDFADLPQIEIRSSQEINGALGAFSRDTNRIYLAQEFISENQSHPEIIAQILLEEIGHWVDSRINVADTPGDEGKIFTALVQGQTLSAEQIQQLKTTDDTATVTIDGQVIEIEQASVSDGGGFEGSEETLTLDSKGGVTLKYSYEHYTIPDNFIIKYDGQTLLDTGFVGGSKSGTVQVPKGNSNQVQVIVATDNEGTAWNYTVETVETKLNIQDAYGVVERGANKTATIKFTVTLSEVSDVETTVKYLTLVGTAVDGITGTDKRDYKPLTGTVTFAPWETTKDIEITIYGDTPVNYGSDNNFEIFARDTAYRDWQEGKDSDQLTGTPY
jgi:hypothetical protein